MTHTLVIGECGSSWRFGDDHLSNAYKLIDAVKGCGADVAKFQWCSNGFEMAKRRGLDQAASVMYQNYLQYPAAYLCHLKAHCDSVGIEFACTVYLPQDIPIVAPLVKRFKISAFEYKDEAFQAAHDQYEKQVIVSVNPGEPNHRVIVRSEALYLHCISEYPCPVERIRLLNLQSSLIDGLSDHTTSVLSGAVAVGCGATIIEKHVKLFNTPQDNPDYPHSLEADRDRYKYNEFYEYVRNVREAERML